MRVCASALRLRGAFPLERRAEGAALSLHGREATRRRRVSPGASLPCAGTARSAGKPARKKASSPTESELLQYVSWAICSINLISGNHQTSSRLPAFSLFLPGSCPNNRHHRIKPAFGQQLLDVAVAQGKAEQNKQSKSKSRRFLSLKYAVRGDGLLDDLRLLR